MDKSHSFRQNKQKTLTGAIIKLQKKLDTAKARKAELEKWKAKIVEKVTIAKYGTPRETAEEVANKKSELLAKLAQTKTATTSTEDFCINPDELLQSIAEMRATLADENLGIREKLQLRARLKELTNLQINPQSLDAEQVVQLKTIAPTVFQKMEQPPVGISSPEEVPEKRTGTLQKHEVQFSDLNEEQQEAVTKAMNGESFCLIGSAGSGKTTTQRQVLERSEDTVGILEETNSHKYLSVLSPSVAIISFTNKAVENIRSAAPNRFKNCCMTIHKLLQYAPEEVLRETFDEYGNDVVVPVRVFRPTFTADNKLPHIDLIIVEEASNISDILYDEVIAALPAPEKTRFIFLGDLNQLPPVVGNPILATKLLELPVVALEKIYRQDSDSAIKKFAQDILTGIPLTNTQVLDKKVKGQFEPYMFPKRVPSKKLLHSIIATLKTMIELGKYVAGEDIILTPNNANGAAINMVNMNLHIADIYREIYDLEIWEIQAGYKKLYLAVGDIVFHNKQYHRIISIRKNDTYSGLPTREPSTNIDRWGGVIDTNAEGGKEADITDFFSLPAGMDMENLSTAEVDDTNKVNKLSHVIQMEPLDVGEYYASVEVSDVGQLKDFQFGYALTVHKSQGSEWRNVFMILHHEAISMARRELLYTGVTRPRECLYLWFDGEERGNWGSSWLQKGIVNQEIPGDTLVEKLKYFRTKQQDSEAAKVWKEKLRKRAKKIADEANYG